MAERDGRLAGKVALITGAGSGIGQAMARLFAHEGAKVAAIGRREAIAETWAGVENVLPIQADITEPDEVERMIGQTESHFGGLDIVCNVAGINDLGYPLLMTSDERWDDVVDLDLKAPFRICRRAVEGMVERGTGGAILNVGSYAALRGNHGPSYTAAKAGLIGMSLSIAVAYASKGVRCNVLNPGAVTGTNIAANSGGEYYAERPLVGIVSNLPVRWICEPDEIAPTALFLCSDEAKHVNGAIIAVDGGMSAC